MASRPKSLAATRLLLHWAAQIPSAAGATLLPARKDASETSLSWDEGSLVGARIAALRALVMEMPPAVTAQSLGYTAECAEDHAILAEMP